MNNDKKAVNPKKKVVKKQVPFFPTKGLRKKAMKNEYNGKKTKSKYINKKLSF
jgi:hypothetical protein